MGIWSSLGGFLVSVCSGILGNWALEPVSRRFSLLCWPGEDPPGEGEASGIVEEIHYQDLLCLQVFSLVDRMIAEIVWSRRIFPQADFRRSFYEPLGVTTRILTPSSRLGQAFSDLVKKGVYIGLQQQKVQNLYLNIYTGAHENHERRETYCFSFAYETGATTSKNLAKDVCKRFYVEGFFKELKKHLQIKEFFIGENDACTIEVHLEISPMHVPLPFFHPTSLSVDGDQHKVGMVAIGAATIGLELWRPGKGKQVLELPDKNSSGPIRKTVGAFVEKSG